MSKTAEITISKPHKLNKRVIKKKQAIELWRETKGHISNVCRAIGISRTTFYDWMKKDQEFAKGLIEAEGELNDDVRDALISKIADGDNTAIIFYLKSRHPDFMQQKNTYIQDNRKIDKIEFIIDDK